MRLVVFFDLPVGTAAQRKEYAKFRKYLVKNGYVMMQESVYSKLAINQRIAKGLIASMRANKPKSGLVQVLTVTEKQYAAMEYVAGGPSAEEEIGTIDDLVVL